MSFNTSLYSIDAILILDNQQNRIFTKYYKAPHENAESDLITNIKKQKQFEKDLFKKTFKQNTDIILFDHHTVVYKEYSDSVIYVIGGLNENEVLLYNVLQGLTGAFEIILNSQLDKRSMLESYDMLVIAIDETVDDGIILETDPSAIAARVTNPPTEDAVNIKIDLSEKGLLSAFNFAKKNISERLQQGF
ncbi:Golgi-to-ER vesicle coat component [Pichia californica]|uniref:Coatomer subunit zeta n=1 Tax=Pichia californica TaxID=460514 RepID=A0A9P6WL80_9ASCO|nr:Golgi-to-ER vesicle coat component [[Candida] californica]KAG0688964.1 Golgi-to-ER vesicle coat component [[Candida] californica]